MDHQHLACRYAGQDDHAADGDLLKGHRQSRILAVSGHELRLGIEFAQVASSPSQFLFDDLHMALV